MINGLNSPPQLVLPCLVRADDTVHPGTAHVTREYLKVLATEMCLRDNLGGKETDKERTSLLASPSAAPARLKQISVTLEPMLPIGDGAFVNGNDVLGGSVYFSSSTTGSTLTTVRVVEGSLASLHSFDSSSGARGGRLQQTFASRNCGSLAVISSAAARQCRGLPLRAGAVITVGVCGEEKFLVVVSVELAAVGMVNGNDTTDEIRPRLNRPAPALVSSSSCSWVGPCGTVGAETTFVVLSNKETSGARYTGAINFQLKPEIDESELEGHYGTDWSSGWNDRVGNYDHRCRHSRRRYRHRHRHRHYPCRRESVISSAVAFAPFRRALGEIHSMIRAILISHSCITSTNVPCPASSSSSFIADTGGAPPEFEVFPPRGVLLVGPRGTGKRTLASVALIAELREQMVARRVEEIKFMRRSLDDRRRRTSSGRLSSHSSGNGCRTVEEPSPRSWIASSSSSSSGLRVLKMSALDLLMAEDPKKALEELGTAATAPPPPVTVTFERRYCRRPLATGSDAPEDADGDCGSINGGDRNGGRKGKEVAVLQSLESTMSVVIIYDLDKLTGGGGDDDDEDGGDDSGGSSGSWNAGRGVEETAVLSLVESFLDRINVQERKGNSADNSTSAVTEAEGNGSAAHWQQEQKRCLPRSRHRRFPRRPSHHVFVLGIAVAGDGGSSQRFSSADGSGGGGSRCSVGGLVRPGRLERVVMLHAPSREHREAVLETILKHRMGVIATTTTDAGTTTAAVMHNNSNTDDDSNRGSRSGIHRLGAASLSRRLAMASPGFVPSDLVRLCDTAHLSFLSRRRNRNINEDSGTDDDYDDDDGDDDDDGKRRRRRRRRRKIRRGAGGGGWSWHDVQVALTEVQPSELRELEVMRSTDGVAEGANGEHASPTQAWTCVGGYASLKDHVRRYVTGPWLDRGSHHDVLGVVAASGAILHGPSGCGKSLTAAAIAAEAKANLVHVRSSELLSKWLGESERLVRRLFSRARAAAPCVLFFDDVDALVGRRNFEGGSSSGSTGKQGGLQTRLLTTLLNEIDGIGSSCGGYSDDAKSAKGKGVLVLAATNRPLSCLDPALLRPGRLQEHLFVGLPASVDDKKTILGLHTGRPAPLSPTALPRRSAPHSLSEHPISSSLHPPSSAPSNPKKNTPTSFRWPRTSIFGPLQRTHASKTSPAPSSPPSSAALLFTLCAPISEITIKSKANTTCNTKRSVNFRLLLPRTLKRLCARPASGDTCQKR